MPASYGGASGGSVNVAAEIDAILAELPEGDWPVASGGSESGAASDHAAAVRARIGVAGAGSGTYAARPTSPSVGDLYVVTSGARMGSVYRAVSTTRWDLERVTSPVSGELLQLDAERFDGSTTGAWVTSWPSETGPVGTAISQSNLHTVLADAAGGLPGVLFGSTAQGIRVPFMGPTGASPRALAMVVSRVIAEGNPYAHLGGWGSSSAGTLFALTVRTGGSNVVGAHWWGSALASSTAPATGTTPSLYLLQYDGTTASLYIDGTLAASGTVSLNTGTAAGLTLGLNPPALNEAARHTEHGSIVWGKVLDSTERAALRAWSQARWNTP